MRLWNLSACVLALLVVACGGEGVTGEPQETAGTLQLPLLSTAPDGKAYKLVGATFTITGPQTVTITDTSTDTVQATLQAGAYTVELVGPWTMERVDAPGTSVPVRLMSPNPLPFFVTKEQTTQVGFQFKLPGDGSADVGIKVDSGGWFSGTIQFAGTYGSEPNPFAELVGKSVPFLVSFESATITKDSWNKELFVQTGPITVQFGGAPSDLLNRAAASMKGGSASFYLRTVSSGMLDIGFVNFMGLTPDSFRLELHPKGPFPGAVDSEGYPVVGPFQYETQATLYDSASQSAYGLTSVDASL